MTKLNKANMNGSVSIILPTKIVKTLGWQQGDDVFIQLNSSKDKVIIEKPNNDV